MAKFFIRFDGAPEDERESDHPSVDDARNEAVMLLGRYLQEHPEYAYQQHWRVDVLDGSRRLRAHVIVATVAAPPSINWDSYDQGLEID